MRHTGISDDLNKRGRPIVHVRDDAGHTTSANKDLYKISTFLWSKMLYNSTMNPLSFLFKVPNGTLAEQASTRELIENVIDEIFIVAKAKGVSVNWENPVEYSEYLFNTLIPLSKKHVLSMLQDMEKKQKTEIDFLNGAIVEYGAEVDVDCPYNRTLFNMVKFVEYNYLSEGEING